MSVVSHTRNVWSCDTEYNKLPFFFYFFFIFFLFFIFVCICVIVGGFVQTQKFPKKNLFALLVGMNERIRKFKDWCIFTGFWNSKKKVVKFFTFYRNWIWMFSFPEQKICHSHKKNPQMLQYLLIIKLPLNTSFGEYTVL